MKRSSKLSLLTAGIAGTLLATSVASVALTACTTQQTTPDSSSDQEQYNWFETQIDWGNEEEVKKLTVDNDGIVYSSPSKTNVIAVTPEFSATTITLPSSVKRITGYVNKVDGKLIPTGAFESSNLESINFVDTNLTNIGPQAFKDNGSLKEISLPSSVKTIEQQAFSGCTKIETINLENVTTIGTDAFRETYGLKSLTFNNESIKLNSIGNGAFMNSGLEGELDLSLATNLYEIGSYAFSSTGLTNVVLPSSLTLLDGGVFQDCKQLTTVNLNETKVQMIKPSTFQGCVELTNVNFPNTLLSIGEDAFNGAIKLEKLDLSNTSINTFGNNSFQDTTKLTTIDLPNEDTLTVIGSSAFLNSGITRLAKKSANEDLGITLPSTIGKLGNSAFANSKITSFDMSAVTSTTLTTLPANFFDNATSLATVKLSDAITTIGEGAFSNATALKEIDLSNTKIAEIGNNAFTGTTSLTKIILPQSSTLKTIGNNAFTNSGLKTLISKTSSNTRAEENKVVLPSSLTTMGASVFSSSAIVDIDMSSTSVTTLPTNTFSNTTNLTNVKLGNKLETIGASAFEGSTALTSIDLSNTNISAINTNAFKDTTKLTTITLQSIAKLKTIGNNAFTNSGLNTLGSKPSGSATLTTNKVELPTSVTTLGTSVFSNSGVVNVDLSKPTSTSMNTLPANTFDGAENLVSVTLKDTLSTIGENAFNNATNLATVTTPNQTASRATVENKVQFGSNLKTIGNNAFGNSGITEVALSSSGLTEIGTNAFSNASKLTTVSLPTNLTTIKNGAFNNNVSLSSVNFGSLSKLTTIEDNNFSDSAISTVDLSTSTSLKGLDGENLFTNMNNLTTVKLPNSFNTLNNQSQLSNSSGQSISEKVFTKKKGDGQVKLTLSSTSFTLSSNTTSIQQSEFFKEYSGELDLSKSSKLTTIKQNTFNNTSVTKLTLPGDQKISFDLGEVSSSTKATDVAPIYYNEKTSTTKKDSLQEISYTAKAKTTTSKSRTKRDASETKLSVSTEALNTIINVMNSYSAGPNNNVGDTVKNLSDWNTTKSSNTRDEHWINDDLTIETGKNWTSNVTGGTGDVDITTKEFSVNTKLFKKHNRIIWMLTYDINNKLITLSTDVAKLYRGTVTNSTTRETTYKQVYFADRVWPEVPNKNMKIRVVIK